MVCDQHVMLASVLGVCSLSEHGFGLEVHPISALLIEVDLAQMRGFLHQFFPEPVPFDDPLLRLYLLDVRI